MFSQIPFPKLFSVTVRATDKRNKLVFGAQDRLKILDGRMKGDSDS
jgi:hypothetical protein